MKEAYAKLERLESEYSDYRQSQGVREDRIRAECAQNQT
jgi:hypothetical protein